MDGLDYWRYCKEVNIIEAVLLILGRDPAVEAVNVENLLPQDQPPGYMALKKELCASIKTDLMLGNIIPFRQYDEATDSYYEVTGSVDLEKSSVLVDELKEWLNYRKIPSPFFFPNGTDAPDYLDPKHPRYAPKLAAAVKAWQAMEDAPPSGKTPKQALTKWLNEHAAEFGLSDDDGKPNATGIEEVAKVANWQPGGGAPKTPA